MNSRADFSGSYLDNVFQLAIKVKCPMGVQLQTFFNTPVWSVNFSAKESALDSRKYLILTIQGT